MSIEKSREQSTHYLPNLAWLFETVTETSDAGSVDVRFSDIMNQAVDSNHQAELADTIEQAIFHGHVIVKSASGKLGITSEGKEAAMDYLTVIHS